MATHKIYIPADPLFNLQWHLLNQGNTLGSVAGHDINVVGVWPDYTGRGVLVGVVDDGIDGSHPDLLANFRADLAWDAARNVPGAHPQSDEDMHGTSVAGLVAATADNGIGGVGVAWNAPFTMYRMDFEDEAEGALLSHFQVAARKMVADGVWVSVNSWGPGFGLNESAESEAYQAAGRYLAEVGRGGLGIAGLYAAGNERVVRMNANYDPTDNSPWHIVVAAGDQTGGITSYSTPGASILVAAPGSDPYSIVTTDRQGSYGYNKEPGTAGNYTDKEYPGEEDSYFGGTSAATPIAGGVVALMLEANPRLGYRDIQEILVYSSKRASFLNRSEDKAFNSAVDWNGGALLASHDFGYGHIDAHAAVRLAESWMKLGTSSNLVLAQGDVAQKTLTVGAGQHASTTANFSAPYRLEQMTVTVDIEGEKLGGLVIELISPDGMVSRLMDTFVTHEDDKWTGHEDSFPLKYTFNTVLNWGTDLAGEWTLRLANTADTGTVQLNDWSILAYTAGAPKGGTQIFTDEFGAFAAAQPERAVIKAADGTTLNAAAATSDVVFDLTQALAELGDHTLTLVDAPQFRHLVAGDGNDTLVGNSASNILMAGRGDNVMDGGAGLDVVRLIGERDHYEMSRDESALVLNSTRLSGGGSDTIYNVELLHFADQVVLVDAPAVSGPDLFDETSYRAQNPDVDVAINAGTVATAYQHYSVWGAHEGRNPNALFDEQWYLAQNTDVAEAVNRSDLASGFQHYLTWGWQESRSPSAWMDTAAYLIANQDVDEAGIDPLGHYLHYGWQEGRTITALGMEMWA